ncbi:pterin-4-alpha-carbinolamine dehydratase superfamily [Verrucomicrobiia bacterium DG1235]|nr:pterin-4-alpha-carbinolamine dehydratase superfamily [Verrucomicrobiae bacterium DG1235]
MPNHSKKNESLRNLAKEAANPPPKDATPLSDTDIQAHLEVLENWNLSTESDRTWLLKTFKFRSYLAALDFTNSVAKLAEDAGHHPRIILEWGKVTVAWHTFDIGGLHKTDFILAAGAQLIYSET